MTRRCAGEYELLSLSVKQCQLSKRGRSARRRKVPWIEGNSIKGLRELEGDLGAADEDAPEMTKAVSDEVNDEAKSRLSRWPAAEDYENSEYHSIGAKRL